jgi:lysine 2,3-aminomutase
VHQLSEYDEVRGISYWKKNYRTGIEHQDPEALNRTYEYYDPIDTLPAEGQQWWLQHAGTSLAEAEKRAAASRNAAEAQKLLEIN